MMFGIIIETNEPEKAWNSVRFANDSLKRGHEVRIFLMGAGVEIESKTNEKYNVKNRLMSLSQTKGLCLLAALV
jgi:sulfur relay (sulfurtransferase) complex TusBCD TusD component (DsrE family)